MIRTLCTLAASVLVIGLLVGCDGGVDSSNGSKGETRRPIPTETKKAPGPGAAGAIQSDESTDEPPPTDE